MLTGRQTAALNAERGCITSRTEKTLMSRGWRRAIVCPKSVKCVRNLRNNPVAPGLESDGLKAVIEVGLKAVIDGLVFLIGKAKGNRLTKEGKAALEEAMKELLMAPNDLSSIEAKIRMAKAAKIINEDVTLAEEWVAKHKAAKAKKKVAKKKAAKKK